MRFLTYIFAAALLGSGAQAFETKAEQAVVVDHTSGSVLLDKNASSKMYPSSMSKLMTLYVLFDKLNSGAITMDTTFPVSEKAWKKGGSKMFVKVNTDVRVEDLLRGIIVQSGNDACIVVAEALAGSEAAFAELMNEKAKDIGLKQSHFANATGWPDEQHYMSAMDLARLTQRLIADFPEYYPYFAEENFTYSGITQPNRNRLLGKGYGVDGLKTGHTEAAGYGIAISTQDEASERRVNVVVNGLESEAERLSEARRLAEYGLREFELVSLAAPEEVIAKLPVWYGADAFVNASLKQQSQLALPRDRSDIRFYLQAMAPIAAPVEQGQTLGLVLVKQGDNVLKSLPVVAAQPIEKSGLFSRFFSNLSMMIR